MARACKAASTYIGAGCTHILAWPHALAYPCNDHRYGFIVMDGNGSLFGTLSGNTREILHKFTVDLPKKHGRGGQSALRFARLRMEKRHNYVRKVSLGLCALKPLGPLRAPVPVHVRTCTHKHARVSTPITCTFTAHATERAWCCASLALGFSEQKRNVEESMPTDIIVGSGGNCFRAHCAELGG